MSQWDYDRPPVWAPNSVITKSGWTDPNTGEVLVAISNLDSKRIDDIDKQQSLFVLESGGFLALEQDLGSDLGIDFLTLEA